VIVQQAGEYAEVGHMSERVSALESIRDGDPPVADRMVSALVELSTAEGDVVQLSQLLSELACAVAGVDGASVEIVAGTDIEFVAATGLLAGSEGTRMPRVGSLSGLVVATAQAKICVDTEDDERVDRDVCRRLGISSMAVVPIRHAHHTVAVLTLACQQTGGVTPNHVQLVEPLVTAGSARLLQAEAASLAASRWALLNTIADASKQVLLADDPGQRLIEAVAGVVGAAHVLLMLPDDDGHLVVARTHGFDPGIYRVAYDETTLSGSAFVTGHTQIVADWANHPKVQPHAIEAMTRAGVLASRAGIFVPLETPDGPAGVLTVFLPTLLTAADAALLGLVQLLAAEAGLAITRAEMARRLADQARTDPLTGLANRRVWSERFDVERDRASRSGEPLALALLDLDHFKAFNDRLGHPAGDDLLCEVSQAWSAGIRPADVLARLGGEEFGVLLPDTDLDTAVAVMDRLRAVVPRGQTVSIGVVQWAEEETADATTRRADEALYAAKAAGRDRVVNR
jgi:diguanylate cyclase (GGDEF)-like protein